MYDILLRFALVARYFSSLAIALGRYDVDFKDYIIHKTGNESQVIGETYNAFGGLSVNPRNPLVDGITLAKDSPPRRG